MNAVNCGVRRNQNPVGHLKEREELWSRVLAGTRIPGKCPPLISEILTTVRASRAGKETRTGSGRRMWSSEKPRWYHRGQVNTRDLT